MGLKVDIFEDVKNQYLIKEDQDYIDEVRYYKKKLILVIKKFDTYRELKENYYKILDKVAAHIQDKIEDELDNLRWNIYLAFIISEKSYGTNELEAIKEIEMDKYCCKKYVLSNIDLKEINEVIEERIPIFLNLEKIKSKKEVEENNNLLEKEELQIPKSIENYLLNEKKSLDDFLKLDFDSNIIDLIYTGEKYEN